MPAEERSIDWSSVKRVLIVKLRSIGDTVLATPSLIALRRFLPAAQIDVLLEDWVAPVLDGFEDIRVISVGKTFGSRAKTALELSRRGYDLAFNLHGGTTATFFVAASRAKHRVGLSDYQYSFVYNHLLTSAKDFWKREKTHSAEQQLALLGSVGIPVEDRPRGHLVSRSPAKESIEAKLHAYGIDQEQIALLHPAAAFKTKQWSISGFARIAEMLSETGLHTVAVSSSVESKVLERLCQEAKVPITPLDSLTLPEITALASRAEIFVGNDSGIAHIAAAVNTPSVVIFGSSNRDHWRPWTDAPHEIVYEEFACQPCPGYRCEVYGEPKCIQSVKVEAVVAAVERVLAAGSHQPQRA